MLLPTSRPAPSPGSVSVALCTWNGKAHLSAQLESIAAQTKVPAELIVCDDVSSDSESGHAAQDSTIGILERFAESAPFPVRIYRNTANLGSVRNFEQAISLCRSEFIALCDQDDLWFPEKLATLSSILMSHPKAGGVFSDGYLLDTSGEISQRTLWQSIRFDQKDQQLFRMGKFSEVLLRRNVVTGMTLMFRASLRDRLLPIPGCWVHDGWLAWTISLNSTLIACPAPLVAYRVHISQQLGVPMSRARKLAWVARHGPGTYFERARTKSIASNRELAEQYQELCSYVEASEIPHRGKFLTQLQQKAELAKASAAASLLSRPQRLKHLVANASNYFQYTQLPLRSLFRDLVL